MARIRQSTASGIITCLSVLALMGCDELTLPGQGTDQQASNLAASGQLRIEEREVEAPEVFTRQDSGLWDGRPSLGGVWIATPNVKAERVRVNNTENGRTITAAMYSLPEDRSPGGFLVSSEAATELGMIGGQRADLAVVALRKETIEIPPVAAPQTVAALEAERLPSATAAGVEEVETASLEAAEEATEEAAALPVAAAEATVDDTAQEEVAARPAPSAESAAASGAAVAAAVTAILAPTPDVPAEEAAPAENTTAAASSAPPARPGPLTRSESRPQETAELTEDGKLVLPFIAVASYSDRDQASAVITQLEVEGIPTKGRLLTDRSGTRYAVLAGPSETLQERAELLAKIKGLGFDGAFASR